MNPFLTRPIGFVCFFGFLLGPRDALAELNLRVERNEAGLEVSWVSESLTRSAPYLHAEFQLEQSVDLNSWSNSGDLVAGGVRASETLAMTATINPVGDGGFYRLRSRLNAPGADLRGQDFSGANLAGANLAGANLSNAIFNEADLSGADVSGATLTGANFADAWLQDVVLDGVNLAGANLGSIRGQVRLTRITADVGADAATVAPKIFYDPLLADFSLNDAFMPGMGASVRNAMVAFKTGTTVGQVNAFLQKYNASILGSAPKDRFLDKTLMMVRFGTTTARELYELTRALKTEPIVAVAAPDLVIGAALVSDDSSTHADWKWDAGPQKGGGNWGLEVGHVPEMWNVLPRLDKESPTPVKTVVFDIIASSDHADLEIANELGGLFPGLSSHGLHVAGTIGATFDNDVGIDGVNPYAQLIGYNLPAVWGVGGQIWEWEHAGSLGYMAIDGMRELLAGVPDVRIVNTSLAFNWATKRDLTPEEKVAAETAALEYGSVFYDIANAASDVLFVTAAGNDWKRIPASQASPMTAAALIFGAGNILVVGAHGESGTLSGFSNEGGHVAAPGEGILSTTMFGGYKAYNGTSMATPFISGVAGFLLAVNPELSPRTLISLIQQNGANVNAFRSLVELDTLDSGTGEKRVLKLLLDIDDGTEDGSLRVMVRPPVPLSYRSFDLVTGTDYAADAIGDGVIDISDFRRWRDWNLWGGQATALNGTEQNLKRDANHDGQVRKGLETLYHPRGDFNGDGLMHDVPTYAMHGAIGPDPLEDWKVFEKSQLWDDEYYDVGKLSELLNSVDISASALNFFALNLFVESAEVSVYDADDDSLITIQKKPFRFDRSNKEHIFTVPVDNNYYLRSAPMDKGDGTFVMMRSIDDLNVTMADRGADYVVDLAPFEMTAKAKHESAAAPAGMARAGGEIIDSDPLADEVDAEIPTEGGFALGQDSTGARAWANEDGTFYTLVRTGILDGNTGPLVDLSSHVVWQRSFTKIPNIAAPTFNVHPMRLMVVDGVRDSQDLKAFAEIRVERRGGASVNWETIFHTKTEIGGHSKGPGGGHTFKILQHEGDLPKRSLNLHEFMLFAGDKTNPVYMAVISGANYQQEEYDGTIPIDDVADGASFEVRYALDARAASGPVDEFAEAYIGDPLHYGTGMRMGYGSFGELPSITNLTTDPDGKAKLAHYEHAKFYYILYRTVNGTSVPVALKLGIEGVADLVDTNPPPAATINSWRVRNYPIDRPIDVDGDGMDDVFELTYAFLNGLDPTDANKDQDDDGFTNVAEYQNGTDILVPDAPERANDLFAGRIVSVAVGSYLRAADLNNDGKTDLMTLSDTFEGSLMVSLSNPDGSFQNPIGSLVAGSQFIDDVILTLLDGDNFVDAVLLDGVARKLFVMRGLGNGRFEKLTELGTVGVPTMVAVGDVNNDSKPDLLVGLKDFKGKIFASQATGGWAPGPDLTLQSVPTHAAVGRFDLDHFPDIAVTLTAGQVALFHGTPGGTFGAPEMLAVGFGPERIAAADLNADGVLDLVTANKSSDSISYYLSAVDGKFGPKTEAAVGDLPSDVRLQDLDGDGRAEIIVSHFGADSHRVLRNLGNGQFAAPLMVPSAESVDRAVLFDANGDAHLDLVSHNWDGQALILFGKGDATFETREQVDNLNAYLIQADAVDLNGDGALEIVTLDLNRRLIDVWEHAATSRTYSRVWSNSVTMQPQSFAVADVSGDGRLDLLVLSAPPEFDGNGTNELLILSASAAGSFTESHRIPTSTRADVILAGDVDGDRDQDIVLVRRFGGELITYLNGGAGALSVEEKTATADGDYASNAFLADIDADGRVELMIAGTDGNGAAFVKVLQRVGTAAWTLRQKVDLAGEASAIRWGNIVGDAAAELIVAMPGRNLGAPTEFETYPVVGGQLGAKEALASAVVGVSQIRVADANRDGRLDLILDGAVMRALPGGGFAAPEVFWTNHAGLVDARDVNEDARPDVIGYGAEAIVILYGR